MPPPLHTHQRGFVAHWASHVALMVKNPPVKAGDTGSIPRSGRSPGEWNGTRLQYSCLENPHRQRSLECYSLWGRKESHMTEHSMQHSEAGGRGYRRFKE